MASNGVGDADEAVVKAVSERELAQWRLEHGGKVVKSGGRYWEAMPWGFYHGLHWMARMEASQARPPSALAWGFRTTLRDEDSAMANGTMPVHLLTDVGNYDIYSLKPRFRTKLRKSEKETEVVELLEPELLKQQGYEICLSAQERTGYGRKPSRSEFERTVDNYFSLEGKVVLGGMVDGKLGAYVFAYAVGGTAYIDTVNVHSRALRSNVGTPMMFRLVQACQRPGNITEIVYGQDTPEDPNLTRYKLAMGFPVVQVPARVWLAPVLRTIIRMRRPHVYYRLTGQLEPEPTPGG